MVNCRKWPEDYTIEDYLTIPPFSKDISIHVFDLQTMSDIGVFYGGHKGFTPEECCFCIYLDTTNDTVAR